MRSVRTRRRAIKLTSVVLAFAVVGVLLAVVLYAGMVVLINGPIMPLRYLVGRDTVKSFGDGRFQIMTGGGLADHEKQRNVLEQLNDHRQKWNLIYACGYRERYVEEQGTEGPITVNKLEEHVTYVLIDYVSGHIQYFKSIDETPEGNRTLFEGLSCE